MYLSKVTKYLYFVTFHHWRAANEDWHYANLLHCNICKRIWDLLTTCFSSSKSGV